MIATAVRAYLPGEGYQFLYILNKGKTNVNVLQFLDSFVMLLFYLIVNDELVYARFR